MLRAVGSQTFVPRVHCARLQVKADLDVIKRLQKTRADAPLLLEKQVRYLLNPLLPPPSRAFLELRLTFTPASVMSERCGRSFARGAAGLLLPFSIQTQNP